MTSSLATSRRGPVTLLRLSCAAKRNALDPEMIAGIETFFRCPSGGTRAIVLQLTVTISVPAWIYQPSQKRPRRLASIIHVPGTVLSSRSNMVRSP